MRNLLVALMLSITVAADELRAQTTDEETAQADWAEELPPFDLPPPPAGVRPQDACGDDDPDWVDVEVFRSDRLASDYVAANAPTTVRYRWLNMNQMIEALLGPGGRLDRNTLDIGNVAGHGWCTGTLIDGGRVLTARHCFDVKDNPNGWITPHRIANGVRTPVPPEVLGTLMVVEFNYQLDPAGSPRPVQSYRVRELLEYGGTARPFSVGAASRLDYAITQLTDDSRSPLRLRSAARVATQNPRANDLAVIIQHPAGDYKKIHFGQVASVTGRYLAYRNIDTTGGSSGSGLRDASGAVRGVHVLGGCRQIGPNNLPVGNRATPIEAIRAASAIL